MSEKSPQPEEYASPDQAKAVIDEIDRITADISLGRSPIEGSVPSKTIWHKGLFFIRYPEGMRSVVDPDSVDLAVVAWDDPDGSRTACSAGATADGILQITTRSFPPSYSYVGKLGGFGFVEFGELDTEFGSFQPSRRTLSVEADQVVAMLMELEPASESTL